MQEPDTKMFGQGMSQSQTNNKKTIIRRFNKKKGEASIENLTTNTGSRKMRE